MRILTGVLLACLAPAVLAAGKVGVVDMERALFLSDAAKTSLEQFEKDNKTEVEQLKKLQQDLMALKEKSEKEADVLSDDERRKMQSSFEEKSTTYKFYAQKLQQAEVKWRQEFFQQQQPNIERELKAIIDADGYDIIMQAGAAIYVGPNADLTKKLIERLNTATKSDTSKKKK